MNFLLTASGLRNETLRDALRDMLGKPFGSAFHRFAVSVTAEHGRKITITADLHRASDGLLLADAEALFFKVSEERAREWQDRYIDPAAWGGQVAPA